MYVLIEIPDGAANVNALKPELKVVIRYGTTSYKYVKDGVVAATVKTA